MSLLQEVSPRRRLDNSPVQVVDFFSAMYQRKNHLPLLAKVTLTSPSLIKHTHSQQASRQQAALINQHLFTNLDLSTSHGKWAESVIFSGTKSLENQNAIFLRMMTTTGVNHPLEVTPDHIIQFLFKSNQTCLPQSLAQYLSQLRSWGEKASLPWASDTIWPLIARGLRAISTPRTHAKPMDIQSFHQITSIVGKELALAASIAFLGGCRLDEVFRFTPRMLTTDVSLAQKFQYVVNRKMSFVAFTSGSQSKTGNLDPDALRFVDVVLLNSQQLQILLMLTKANPNPATPLFSNRRALTAALNYHGFTDHSFKGGTANLLSVMIRDGDLPETLLPIILKHKNSQEQISSTTAGYLSINARLNILQNKDVFQAAVLLRRAIFQDI